MANATPDRRTKVFISYSRADADWADQLCAFLRDAGFSPILDRTEIESAEIWKRRLGALLLAADAVVFVLTDDSATSEMCAWQLHEAQRLGKRILPVLPEELTATPPAGLAEISPIYFYSDQALPDSGFYDGQKQLEAALKADLQRSRTQTELAEQEQARTDASNASQADERAAWNALRADREALEHELKRAREALARQRKEEKRARAIERGTRQVRDEWMYASPATPGPVRRKRGLPVFRLTLLAAFAALIYFSATNADVRREVRRVWDEVASTVLAPAEEQTGDSASRVPAQAYTPERPMYAGANGANVRDYPLPSATILSELPARAALNVTGRLEVQGDWWFRIVLDDGRTGFVHEDAVTRRQSPANAPSSTAAVQAIDPAVEAMAGRAGANIRALPGLRAARLVWIEAGAPVMVTGKLRQGGHAWYRLRLEDGREGFARDDVLVTRNGEALRL